ncbi:MAG TPA: DUF6069 family protein [Chloroflexia bacterium]|nr:DUF6069 family protein [Chloroflexia bacterium]
MSSTTLPAPQAIRGQEERVDIRRLLWVGPLAMIVPAIANVIVREVAVAVGAVPANLEILQWPGIIGSTMIQVLLGVIVFAVIARFSRRPIWLFRVVAVVALLLSFSSPLMAAAGLTPIPGLSINASTVVSMMVMHVVAAVISVGILTTLARKKQATD